MVTFLDKGENPMMVYPLGKNRGEARHKGEVMRPQCQQSGKKIAADTEVGSIGYLNGKNQQRDGDGENAIAECFNPPGFFSF